LKEDNDTSRPSVSCKIELAGEQFRRRLCPRRHPAIHQFRWARRGLAGWGSKRGSTTVAQADNDADAQDKLTRINKWYCEQLAYLAKRLAETPGTGRDRQPADNTLLVWTNELGQGNPTPWTISRLCWSANGLNFRMGRSLPSIPRLPHNRLLLALGARYGVSRRESSASDYCGDGPLPNLT